MGIGIMPLKGSWRDLLKPEIQEFMTLHHDTDVRELALKKAPDASWPYALIMDQIKVRQRAKIKSYDLYDTDRFIWPSYEIFEQSSSFACAKYKAAIIKNYDVFMDLTAGSGSDAFAFARRAKASIFLDRDKNNCEILSHNSSVLGGDIETLCDAAENYIFSMPQADLVFIDPQRRDNGRKGFFAFDDCSPNILELLPQLREKTKYLIVKASPLLDIQKGINDLKYVSQVHVVQWQRECKEILFVLDFEAKTSPESVRINAVDLDDDGAVLTSFSFAFGNEKKANIEYAMPKQYIYEPDPAFQKAGGFKSMAHAFSLHKIHPNTQLYTSDEKKNEFPGKIHKVIRLAPVSKKGLDFKHADICVRNFPMSARDLRKKLRISEGGMHRVYAATLANEKKMLIICKKI